MLSKQFLPDAILWGEGWEEGGGGGIRKNRAKKMAGKIFAGKILIMMCVSLLFLNFITRD